MSPQKPSAATGVQHFMALAIRAELAHRNMTQQELARRTGISEKHLSQILRGHEMGSLAMWDEIALSLGTRWTAHLGRCPEILTAPASGGADQEDAAPEFVRVYVVLDHRKFKRESLVHSVHSSHAAAVASGDALIAKYGDPLAAGVTVGIVEPPYNEPTVAPGAPSTDPAPEPAAPPAPEDGEA